MSIVRKCLLYSGSNGNAPSACGGGHTKDDVPIYGVIYHEFGIIIIAIIIIIKSALKKAIE